LGRNLGKGVSKLFQGLPCGASIHASVTHWLHRGEAEARGKTKTSLCQDVM